MKCKSDLEALLEGVEVGAPEVLDGGPEQLVELVPLGSLLAAQLVDLSKEGVWAFVVCSVQVYTEPGDGCIGRGVGNIQQVAVVRRKRN